MTTRNGGIKDVFEEGANGFFICKDRLVRHLRQHPAGSDGSLISRLHKYEGIAVHNRLEALKKYSEESFCRNIMSIV